MNREQDIKTMQGELDGRKVEIRGKRVGTWNAKDKGLAFNFQEYEYRIAPDVVYKIQFNGDDHVYSIYDDDNWAKDSIVTKGYWVEGEAS